MRGYGSLIMITFARFALQVYGIRTILTQIKHKDTDYDTVAS